jgi:serine/threonine-protein kinase
MSDTPHSPQYLGRYELLFLLGQGGMGEVHLAKLSGAAGFEKLYIVKTILPQMQADPQFVERFHHEARVLVQLNHSNIAQVHDMGEVAGRLYLAIEYVPGVDLSRVLSRVAHQGAVIPVPIALYLGQQMCEALGYAHRKTGADGALLGIVHRDVSPQNVMVSYEGGVKVIDFGLAKSAARSQHTLPSTVMGKLGYMSPEQAMARPVDHRSDIYSAGIIIWEMLAGRPLIQSGSMGEMVAQMANPAVPSLRPLRPEISPMLEQIVARALAKDPVARYARADEFSRALNELAVREQLTVGAEEVGNYVRAMCPEEFAAERRLQSKLSIMRKKGGPGSSESPAHIPGSAVGAVPLAGTFVRGSGPVDADDGSPMTPAQRALSIQAPSKRPSQPGAAIEANVLEEAVVSGRRARILVGLGALVVLSIGVGIGIRVLGAPEGAASSPAAVSAPPGQLPAPESAAAPQLKVPAVNVSPSKPPPPAETETDDGTKAAAHQIPEESPDEQPSRMIEVSSVIGKVFRRSDGAYLMLQAGQSVTNGERLNLIGEAVEGTARRPFYGNAAVLSIQGSLVSLLVDDGVKVPDQLFAAHEVGGAAARKPERIARAQKTRASAPQGTVGALRMTSPSEGDEKSGDPAMLPNDPFVGRVETSAAEPAPNLQPVTNVPGAPAASEKPSPERQSPEPQTAGLKNNPALGSVQPAANLPAVRGEVRIEQAAASGHRVVFLRNTNPFPLLNCHVRLPMNRSLSLGKRSIPARGPIKVDFDAVRDDSRPADPRFKENWAAVYCREGTGYFWTSYLNRKR